MLKLSVVLPTYNEADNIKVLIPELESFLRNKNIDSEILIIDDNSPDGTARIVRYMDKNYGNIRVIVREKKEGIGAALRLGYTHARGEYIISLDSDLSFKVEDMGKLIEKLEEGYDLVVGSRHISEGDYKKPNLRIKIKGLISLLGNKMVRIVTGINLHDFSANFRIVRSAVWRSIRTDENTNSILLEMIMKASYKGYKVVEIPVTFSDRLYGKSKLNLSKEAPKFLAKMLLFTIRFRIMKHLD